MSNEISIVVKGTNESGPATRAAKEGIDSVGKAAEKATNSLQQEDRAVGAVQRSMAELAIESKALSGSVDNVGKSMTITIDKAGRARDEFGKFVKMGGEADKAFKETAKLGESLGKEVAKGGEQAAKGILDLSVSMKDLPGADKIKWIAAALAALPAIAAAGGAALAGIGLVGITAGIIGAVQEAPRISTAFNNELDKVEAKWKAGASDFIEPTLGAVKELGDAVNGIPIQKAMSSLAQYEKGIGSGVASAVSSIGTGVSNMISKAGPVLKALGPDIAGLGHSVEEALTSIGDGAKGGEEALTQVIHVAGAAIEVTGKLVGWFENAYDAVDHFAHGVTDAVDEIAKFDPLIKPLANWQNMWDDRQPAAFGSVLPGVSQSLGDVNQQAADAATALADLNNQMSSAINNALGLENANVAVAEGFDGLAKAVKGHARSLDINSEAGRTNISVVTDMIGKLEQQREKAIEAGDGSAAATEKANAAFQSQVGSLRAALTQLGFNKAAVDALIGSLDRIPRVIDTHVTVHVAQVGSTSVQGVISGGAPLHAGTAFRHAGVVGRAASGGMRSGLTWVGEDGPELMDLSGMAGAQIHTNGDSKRIAKGGGGYGMGGGQTLTLVVKAGDNTARTLALVKDIRDYVSLAGGDGTVLGIRSN